MIFKLPTSSISLPYSGANDLSCWSVVKTATKSPQHYFATDYRSPYVRLSECAQYRATMLLRVNHTNDEVEQAFHNNKRGVKTCLLPAQYLYVFYYQIRLLVRAFPKTCILASTVAGVTSKSRNVMPWHVASTTRLQLCLCATTLVGLCYWRTYIMTLYTP